MHHSTDRITHTTAFVTPVVEHWLEREIAQWVSLKHHGTGPSVDFFCCFEVNLYSTIHYIVVYIRFVLHSLCPLSYFSFQPVLHDWCNKGRGMCYPVCGMVHIKEPLLLIDKSSLCGGSGFPFSLSEWSLTICMTPYNRR